MHPVISFERVKLDTRERRRDFSSLELAVLLAAYVSGLTQHAPDLGTVLGAVEQVRAILLGDNLWIERNVKGPVRKDLSDREIASHLGAIIGGCVRLSTPAAVRRAIRWWAQQPLSVFERLSDAPPKAENDA